LPSLFTPEKGGRVHGFEGSEIEINAKRTKNRRGKDKKNSLPDRIMSRIGFYMI
jgi:hypothetical protein